MTDTNVCYEYLVAQVKPRYLIQMLEEMKNGRKMFEKHGAKTLGLWLTEAGDIGKIVRLMEWPSVDKRTEVMALRFKDPEMTTFFETTRKFLVTGESFLCKMNTDVHMRTFSPTQPVWINRYKPNRSDPLTTDKLVSMLTKWEKECSVDCCLNALLHPICFTDKCMIAIWQMKDGHKIDRCLNKIHAQLRDTEKWGTMEECRTAFECTKSVICNPVNSDEMPISSCTI